MGLNSVLKKGILVAHSITQTSANINAKSKSQNSTPLDEAIRRKHSKITDILRENGAKEGEELEAGKN